MADFGEVTYINAAVQVIPVLAIFAVADSFIRRRDVEDPVERIFASSAVAVGLLFGIGGEILGLQALLTGPTRQTIPTVNAGLMALGATALVPAPGRAARTAKSRPSPAHHQSNATPRGRHGGPSD
jgi:hypothetical protein